MKQPKHTMKKCWRNWWTKPPKLFRLCVYTRVLIRIPDYVRIFPTHHLAGWGYGLKSPRMWIQNCSRSMSHTWPMMSLGLCKTALLSDFALDNSALGLGWYHGEQLIRNIRNIRYNIQFICFGGFCEACFVVQPFCFFWEWFPSVNQKSDSLLQIALHPQTWTTCLSWQ